LKAQVRVLGHAVWITVLFYILQDLTLKLVQKAGLGPGLSALVESIPSLAAIVTVLFLARGTRSLGECLAHLGFKAAHGQNLGLGLALATPVLVGYAEGYLAYTHKGFSVVLFPQWPFLLAWFLTGTLFEELVFRGYLFQSLRERWAFWPAALASSLLWALAHMGHVFLGSNVRFLFPDTILFFVGLAGAYVFERSGNSILPWMIVHMSINLVGLVNIGDSGMFLTPLGAPIGYLFGGEILCILTTYPIIRWLLPRSPSVS
jgi:hypothetical protein